MQWWKQAIRNGMKWRKEDEQALLGKRQCGGPVVVAGSARKKYHGRTDQLEDRNIILNSKLILVSNDYWNKIKPHHRNLQTIGFQNLLELTQDLVVVLKDHEFLSHISMYTFMMGSKKQHNLHDLSTQDRIMDPLAAMMYIKRYYEGDFW